jgi:hypothetical protein
MKNMKKLFTPLMLTLFLVLAAVPVMALAEGEPAAATPTEPLTWAYLATIAGAATFTLLVVQLFKVPLDKVWKIPTRVFVYIVCLATMLLATAFTTGLTIENAALAALNAVLATFTAMGEYEITFAKLNK